MIITDRFILRPFKLADKKSLAKHANNKKISDNLRDRFPCPYTEEDAEWFVNFVLSDNDPVKHFIIEINNEAVGVVSVSPDQDVYRLNAEIGYWLGEEHWCKGIMTNVIKMIVKYIFKHFAIKRIYAMPFTNSFGSVKTLKKVGFC